MASRRPKAITQEAGITVTGLVDFTVALGLVEKSYPKQVSEANYTLAKYLTDESKRSAAGQGGVANKAAKSLRASRSARFSAITGGGPRAPWFLGAEFGSVRYGQFKQWRGNQWGGWNGGPGYFLHPTIRTKGGPALEKYMHTLDELTSKAFPD